MPKWLYKELVDLGGCSTDMTGKLERAITADKVLRDDLERAPDTRRRTLLRQLMDKTLDSRKSARDKSKDHVEATAKHTKVNVKGQRLSGEDFASAVVWDSQAIMYADGTVAQRLDTSDLLGEEPGYALVTLAAGKKYMEKRKGKPDVY